MNPVIRFANRTLAFTPGRRLLFFTMLANYERSGIPLVNTLEAIQKLRETPVVPDVGELCAAAVEEHEPIASKAAAAGYFTDREAALLAIGERYEKLEAMVALIIEQMKGSGSAFAVMVGSKIGLAVTIILMGWIYSLLGSLASASTVDYSAVRLVNFVSQNSIVLVAIMFGGYVMYRVVRRTTTGTIRRRLNKVGLFAINDKETEFMFLTVCAALAKANVDEDEIYETLTHMLNDQPYLTEKMIYARNQLETVSFEDGLIDVVSEQSYTNIRAKSPSGAMAQIGEGCDLARGILMENLTLSIATMSWLIDLVLYTFMFYLALPLVLMSMGSGISL